MPFIEPKNPSVMALRGLHLYLAGVSNCSMGVRMRLEEEGLSWESLHLDLLKEESITEEYFGIKPHGLVHDGRVMIESDDIIEYLDQAFPTPCAAAAKRWGIAADVGLVATGHPHSPQSGPNAHLRKQFHRGGAGRGHGDSGSAFCGSGCRAKRTRLVGGRPFHSGRHSLAPSAVHPVHARELPVDGLPNVQARAHRHAAQFPTPQCSIDGYQRWRFRTSRPYRDRLGRASNRLNFSDVREKLENL